ncbi:MAG: hypothetical protein IT232_06575 [Flavobacteriales bacterium]|nr:hypothetical protein [Flavobacteriales bacterium]
MNHFIKIMLFLVVVSNSISTYGQENNHPQTKEYASVYVKIFYQGDIVFYDTKGASQSPLLIMPDGKKYIIKKDMDKDKVVDFVNSNEIINFMARFGWEVNNSTILPYEGGIGNDSKSVLVNTNHYFQKITFERTFVNSK